MVPTRAAGSPTNETDIEHIVARSEAHDSGLCVADEATRRRFATDLLNLAGKSRREPEPEARSGCRGVVTRPEPVLVRRP